MTTFSTKRQIRTAHRLRQGGGLALRSRCGADGVVLRLQARPAERPARSPTIYRTATRSRWPKCVTISTCRSAQARWG